MRQSKPAKTYSPANRFSFKCPIFGAEVEMRSCLKLYDLFARGEKPETRRGCQACMSAGKCPIWAMQRMIYLQDIDPYFAAEKEIGALSQDLLGRIAPVLVLDRTLRQYNVPARETELIMDANQAAVTGASSKVYRSFELEQVTEPVRRKREPAIEKPSEPKRASAYSGDMTAALNKAIERETTEKTNG